MDLQLKLTDTLSHEKKPFKPLKEGEVSLYVCGVTVYDHCHIGHARGAVVFDVLRRYLEGHYKLKVQHVRNITDLDDKIIVRAINDSDLKDLTPKRACLKVANQYTESFQQDFKKLGFLHPNREPKATRFIKKMQDFIRTLLDKNFAYVGQDGVYFSVQKLSDCYGQLSKQKLDQMLEGVRVEPVEGKRDPLDFALWKRAKRKEPSWRSPWGNGRPGWHIECTTMATEILGKEFDIHGGGQDLIFPHHENERAQALGAGMKFARYWLHNGLLTVDGQKMSKSAGNFVYIREALKREVLKKNSADALRMFFLSAHYKSPLDFTWGRLDEADHSYENIKEFFKRVSEGYGATQPEDRKVAKKGDLNGLEQIEKKSSSRFFEAMDDDLNTPEALAEIHLLIRFAKGKFGSGSRSACNKALLRLARDKVYEQCRILGFFQYEQMETKTATIGGNAYIVPPLPPEAQQLVSEREDARRKKDFKRADEIRHQLMEQGYGVEDDGDETRAWKRV